MRVIGGVRLEGGKFTKMTFRHKGVLTIIFPRNIEKIFCR